jgi:SAM-dependent methyltransferase
MAKIDFEAFDQRGYRTVGAREGYAEWAPTYQQTVEDELDLALLARLSTVAWSACRSVADLGCGTGRTGAWLAEQGAGADAIDGVDLTPEMLDLARSRGVHSSLREGDVRSTGLQSARYDLAITSLVDEHIPSVAPLYAEAARLLRPEGAFVIVGYHPHFVMASGMPTHYDRADGESVAIETHVHQLSEHVTAGLAAGLRLTEMHERIIDDVWVGLKPKWERFRGHPITFALAWRKDSAA